MKNAFQYCIPFITIALLSAGCDEELPPRDDPSKIFTGNLGVTYIYTAQQNGIYLTVTVVNNSDETLSGNAAIDGKIEIEWIVPLDRIESFVPKRNIPITSKNIFRAHGYNSSTGKLLIDPQDSIMIGYLWDFKFDDGTDIRDVPYYQVGAKNIGCGNFTVRWDGERLETRRLLFQSQPFKVNCSLKFFDKTAYIQLPEKIVSSCSINFWPDQICPGIVIPDAYHTPCDLR